MHRMFASGAALLAALFLTASPAMAATVPYPPDGPSELPRTDSDVTLECAVAGDGYVKCEATGYASGSDVLFDVAAPASASSFSVVPVALPEDYVVLASGNRVSNGELVAVLEFPYPCAISSTPITVRSSGHDVLGDPAVRESSVSTTEAVCVQGVTLERLRAIVAGGDSGDGDIPLAQTGFQATELFFAAVLGLSLGGLLVIQVRRRREAVTDIYA